MQISNQSHSNIRQSEIYGVVVVAVVVAGLVVGVVVVVVVAGAAKKENGDVARGIVVVSAVVIRQWKHRASMQRQRNYRTQTQRNHRGPVGPSNHRELCRQRQSDTVVNRQWNRSSHNCNQ